MIQRRQNLYLALMAIICMIMLTADMQISIGSSNDGKNLEYMNSISGSARVNQNGGKTDINENQMLVVCLMISCLVSLTTVFMYKKLALQRKMVMVNFLVLVLIIIFMVKSQYDMSVRVDEFASLTYGFGLLMPVLLIVLNVLSFRGIKKDMDLLASVDRLR